jgi:hypothetical protein
MHLSPWLMTAWPDQLSTRRDPERCWNLSKQVMDHTIHKWVTPMIRIRCVWGTILCAVHALCSVRAESLFPFEPLMYP